jgi:hypothetical protein
VKAIAIGRVRLGESTQQGASMAKIFEVIEALCKKSPDYAQMAVRVHVLVFKDYYFLHKAGYRR